MSSPRHTPLQRRFVAGLLVALLLAACGPAAVEGPRGFNIDYGTGAIPPPYNYQYTIDVEFDEQGANVTYLLEYLYRENMTEEELTAAGYSVDDDIRWSGVVGPDVAQAWREVARTAALSGNDEPLPGGDTMLVRVAESADAFRAGVPVDRGPWEEIARDVDQAARAALNIDRPAP